MEIAEATACLVGGNVRSYFGRQAAEQQVDETATDSQLLLQNTVSRML